MVRGGCSISEDGEAAEARKLKVYEESAGTRLKSEVIESGCRSRKSGGSAVSIVSISAS